MRAFGDYLIYKWPPGSARHRLCPFFLLSVMSLLRTLKAWPSMVALVAAAAPQGAFAQILANITSFLLWLDEQQSWPDPVLSYCLPREPLLWWKLSDLSYSCGYSIFRSPTRWNKPLPMQFSNLLTDKRVWRLPGPHSCDLEFLENLLLNGLYPIISNDHSDRHCSSELGLPGCRNR